MRRRPINKQAVCDAVDFSACSIGSWMCVDRIKFCCLLQSRSDYLFPALEATSELFLVLSRNMLGQRRLHLPQGVQVPYKTHGFAFKNSQWISLWLCGNDRQLVPWGRKKKAPLTERLKGKHCILITVSSHTWGMDTEWFIQRLYWFLLTSWNEKHMMTLIPVWRRLLCWCLWSV